MAVDWSRYFAEATGDPFSTRFEPFTGDPRTYGQVGGEHLFFPNAPRAKPPTSGLQPMEASPLQPIEFGGQDLSGSGAGGLGASAAGGHSTSPEQSRSGGSLAQAVSDMAPSKSSAASIAAGLLGTIAGSPVLGAIASALTSLAMGAPTGKTAGKAIAGIATAPMGPLASMIAGYAGGKVGEAAFDTPAFSGFSTAFDTFDGYGRGPGESNTSIDQTATNEEGIVGMNQNVTGPMAGLAGFMSGITSNAAQAVASLEGLFGGSFGKGSEAIGGYGAIGSQHSYSYDPVLGSFISDIDLAARNGIPGLTPAVDYNSEGISGVGQGSGGMGGGPSGAEGSGGVGSSGHGGVDGGASGGGRG